MIIDKIHNNEFLSITLHLQWPWYVVQSFNTILSTIILKCKKNYVVIWNWKQRLVHQNNYKI